MTTIDLPSISPASRATLRPAGRRIAPAETVVATDRPSLGQRLASLLGTLLMITAIAAVLFFAIGPRFLGYQTATMLTGSMAPEIMPGDVVVTTLQPVSGIAVGDVISYHIPVEDHRVETHRVVEVIRGTDGTTAVRTKGDANDSVDPWTATLEGDHVYEARAVIPEVGSIIRALRTPVVSQLLVYGVPAVLVGGLLLMIWSRPKDDADDAAGATGTPAPGAHTAEDISLLPVLDRQTLDDLGAELSNQAGALQFAGMFVDMLPQRIDAIDAAFGARDGDAAVVALLSLNVSASMVGARRLEEASSSALELVGEPDRHEALIDRLRILGSEYQAALGGIIR
ncbi:signal peptidase I [uncultured Arthrobacter sp.]|uniref:signal peptidase I n=1 Tax=uncultured Arthrobacter sp. TaxID=114050 RepID=UPI002638F894|nr:signal peptidase I [uncultured Arthrobacter sp.]